MKPLHLWAATFLLLLAVSPALADVAPPDHKKVEKPDAIRGDLQISRMTIEPVAGLREARLQVPRSLLLRLPAAPGGVAGAPLAPALPLLLSRYERRLNARDQPPCRPRWCGLGAGGFTPVGEEGVTGLAGAGTPDSRL